MHETSAHEKETGVKQVTKEDNNLFKDSSKLINNLSAMIGQIEQQEEMEKERFKKELEKLIPVLLTDVQTLKDESEDPKYLDITQEESEMIK